MKLEETIQTRRSLFPKQMSGEMVPNGVIEKMLELANWAPTHRNTEPWRFKVYGGKAMTALLDYCKECYVKETPSHTFNSMKVEKIEQSKTQVSRIVAICKKRNDIVPEFEEIAATAMAVQNMWLYLASTEKYGGYWSTPSYAMGNHLKKYLNLEENERCLGLFYIGTIAQNQTLPKGHRGDWRNKVTMQF